MARRFDRRYEVALEDLDRLCNCIVEHADAREQRAAERLLALLSTLGSAARERGDKKLRFAAPHGTGALVDRALAAMARSDRHVERFERNRRTAA